MYDWQLEKVLRSDPYTSKLFRGVYPTDCLPKAIKFPATLIANTQVVRRVNTGFHSTFYLRGMETSLIPMAIPQAVRIQSLESG